MTRENVSVVRSERFWKTAVGSLNCDQFTGIIWYAKNCGKNTVYPYKVGRQNSGHVFGTPKRALEGGSILH